MLLATLAGLAVAAWVFGAAGVGDVVRVAGRIGPAGFLIFCLYSLAVFWILGAAWLAAAEGEPLTRLPLFTWGRMIREAVADLLPFSQIGGIVVGAGAIADGGVAPSRVWASLIADMTTEMASQLVFTLFGIALIAALLAGEGGAGVRPLVAGGVAAMAALVALFFGAQRLLLVLAERMAGRVLPGSAAALGEVHAELARLYRHPRRIAVAFALNLAAWTASAMGAWIVLRLVAVPLPARSVLSLESLIFTLRSVAFFVPGAIGVQEAGYALVAPLFGLPAEAALALSLAKRAKDLAIGLPSLVAWQLRTARALVAR